MTKAKLNSGIGSGFDDFLREEGIYEDVQEAALLRVFAWKIREAMKAQAITKVEMARRMNTSRSQLDRLLDPKNDHIELATLAKAANAVGHKLSLELVD
ncbi:MAG: Fis family transcriptional regulator [Rhodobacterales bacterium CG15_BIG_FIL_POST_REV_8_21_14_020_59_13]|nr:MAG: Fis family transcriptional regulator [Rhodobacterales bacterium CG15_BIG_FIL_POST_REV_8_21_14_020_59_13]